ncbi:MAG: YicC family protein [Clostridium sp.]|nr:YicC family protein [Clostridium sp.]MCM1398224.1 YicC family protein [Clostridium sp.]MCM1460362.1 YicC family protein [Bacteroides sp.]
MIKSMTGFGRGEVLNEDRKIVVEIKAVNHRYCDMNIKLPRKLNYFENAVRGFLKDYIQRGKVDVYITYEDYSKSNVNVKYNRDVAEKYVNYLRQMAEEFGIGQDMSVSVVGRFPEVFALEEEPADQERVWEYLKEVLTEATDMFVDARISEGENLKEDLVSKLDEMLEMVTVIEEKSPELIAEYKAKLIEKIDELSVNTQIDEQRIATEVTIYADKICVDEEIVRLKSHISTAKDILISGGAVGRKLDFIAQEMNREANTILSKSNSLKISDIGIDLKTNIEKVREQIQNIE